jgi:hypothetical protein
MAGKGCAAIAAAGGENPAPLPSFWSLMTEDKTDCVSPSPDRAGGLGSGFTLPAVIADEGDKAAERFFTFFTDNISNPNTRAAY